MTLHTITRERACAALLAFALIFGAIIGSVALASSSRGATPDKVTICHVPPGNPENAHTITVSENAVPAHLAHGDYLGECKTEPTDPEPTEPPEPDPTTPTEPEPTDPVTPEPTTPVEPEPVTPEPTNPVTPPSEPEPTTPVEPVPAPEPQAPPATEQVPQVPTSVPAGL